MFSIIFNHVASIKSINLIYFRLTPKQLVQTMFYANINRRFLLKLPMYDIEHEIFSHYDEFTVKELGILSLGFFKTQTPIRNQELVKKLYGSVISEISNINSLNLAAFLKVFLQIELIKMNRKLNEYQFNYQGFENTSLVVLYLLFVLHYFGIYRFILFVLFVYQFQYFTYFTLMM